MAKITEEPVKISTPAYPSKVLQDLLSYGGFYISTIDGEDSIGEETICDVIVYGILSPCKTLVQGFLIDGDSLALPYGCLTTWEAGWDMWERLDVKKFMQENPFSCMDAKCYGFLTWLNDVVKSRWQVK